MPWRTWTAVLVAVATCGPQGGTLDQTLSSEHYLYRYASGDHVDVDRQEAYHAWLIGALPIAPAGPVEYRKYKDRAHMEAVTGRATNGFADTTRLLIHTIWPWDNHEVVHTLVIRAWGHPPALFNEGIAVAHQANPAAGDLAPRWNGQDLHALTRAADAAGRLPDLSRITTSTGFFDFDTQLTYPMAGSFVRWLIDTRGLGPIEALFRTSSFGAPAADTEAKFQAAYGTSLSAAWREWRDWLATTG